MKKLVKESLITENTKNYNFNWYVNEIFEILKSPDFNLEPEEANELRDLIVTRYRKLLIEFFEGEESPYAAADNFYQLYAQNTVAGRDIEIKLQEPEEEEKEPDYSKMSKYDIHREIDKALDSGDTELLKKLQPFVKEHFLKKKIETFLNESKEL